MASDFQKAQLAKKIDWPIIALTIVLGVSCFYLALKAVA